MGVEFMVVSCYVDHSDNLGCVNCSLTSNLASFVLECISKWDFIKTLDLSQNKLGEDPEKFYSWMFNHIFGTITIENLILTDNGFSEEWKKKIVSTFEKYTNITL